MCVFVCVLRTEFNVTPLLGECSGTGSVGQDAKAPGVNLIYLFTFDLLVL